jgi:5-methylcytosine-specific restriction endonuclease McrA
MRKTTPITEERLAELKAMGYREYLHTGEWARKRWGAMKRAGFRCQLCNSPDNLQVHHRCYDRLGDERWFDLLCLCAECHELFHRNRRLVRVEVSA